MEKRYLLLVLLVSTKLYCPSAKIRMNIPQGRVTTIHFSGSTNKLVENFGEEGGVELEAGKEQQFDASDESFKNGIYVGVESRERTGPGRTGARTRGATIKDFKAVTRGKTLNEIQKDPELAVLSKIPFRMPIKLKPNHTYVISSPTKTDEGKICCTKERATLELMGDLCVAEIEE